VAPFDGRAPDVLVLGGGGLLGEAWMTGVLAGFEEATGADTTRCRAWVGTSAGSIVAAGLAAGRRPRRGAGPPAAAPAQTGSTGAGSAVLRRAAGAVTALGAVGAPVGLSVLAPAGARARALVLGRVPDGRRSLGALQTEVGRWGGAAWEDGLRVCAVDLESGRRVVFGSGGAPAATVGQAVAASCAIPGVFRPITIEERRYVDGGAWSPTNADAAPAGRGDRVLVLEPTAVLLRGALRAAGAVEALALRRRGARVHLVTPAPDAARLMGALMRPDKGDRVLAAGWAQGLALGA
jgi:NTE family protein